MSLGIQCPVHQPAKDALPAGGIGVEIPPLVAIWRRPGRDHRLPERVDEDGRQLAHSGVVRPAATVAVERLRAVQLQTPPRSTLGAGQQPDRQITVSALQTRRDLGPHPLKQAPTNGAGGLLTEVHGGVHRRERVTGTVPFGVADDGEDRSDLAILACTTAPSLAGPATERHRPHAS